MTDFRLARENMVESQVRPNGVTDRRIITAMAAIPREDFVPKERRELAYIDEDVPIAGAADGLPARWLIEPMVLARLVQLAAVEATDRVLHIGAATGYGSVLLSQLARSVIALESDKRLIPVLGRQVADCGNVTVEEGALAMGWPAAAPYDVILIEGRVGEVPGDLFAQLNEGGRLAAVVNEADMCRAYLWTKVAGVAASRPAFDAGIAPLPGFAKQRPAFVF